MRIHSILACMSVIVSAASYATTTESKRGLVVKADFQFQNSKKSFQVKYDSIFAENNNTWTPLGPAVDGVALLGKLHRADKGTFQMEYMVVDTSSSPVALNQMSVISELGKNSSI